MKDRWRKSYATSTGTTAMSEAAAAPRSLPCCASGGEVEAREHGWQEATRAGRGAPLARESFTREGGYRIALRLFDGSEPPTAHHASSSTATLVDGRSCTCAAPVEGTAAP